MHFDSMALGAVLACAGLVPGCAQAQPRRLQESGGRVAWYHGPAHDLIAFDAVVSDSTGDTELYVVRPDGSGRECVTCGVAALSNGFIGQPAWHPDGEHLVLQVENRRSEHRFYNHLAWGIDNDLWLVRRDGSGARRLWSTSAWHAALHPHFSDDGRLLVFAERVPTGRKLADPRLRLLGPDGESQWEGWRIHIADVDISRAGEDVLFNHRTLAPNGPGFYETHALAPDGRLVYSFTAEGGAWVDDGYSARLDGGDVQNLTASPATWDEHAQYSPDGRRLAFISSRADPTLRFPGTPASELRTELFVADAGEPRAVTDMNTRLGRAIVVSDFDWDRGGRRIVYQVAAIDGSRRPELWIVEPR
jgi:Tol biopolymer transport system component